MNEHVRRGQDVSEIFDIRDYQDGDNLRAIHWKLSGKQDKLLVREFGEASSFDTLILFQIALTGQEENIAHNLLNYAIRLGCGVCTSLARQGIGYHLGLMNEGELEQRAVENPGVFMRALTEYMSMPIPKYTEDLLRFFMASLQYQKFRKIVLITGRVDAALQKRLAEYVNLTVIVPAEDGVSSSALTDGYDLISISMNEIGEKEHYITI